MHLQVKENELAEKYGRPKQNRISFAGYQNNAYWFVCVPPAACVIHGTGTLV